jgi:hypothetical protein
MITIKSSVQNERKDKNLNQLTNLKEYSKASNIKVVTSCED